MCIDRIIRKLEGRNDICEKETGQVAIVEFRVRISCFEGKEIWYLVKGRARWQIQYRRSLYRTNPVQEGTSKAATVQIGFIAQIQPSKVAIANRGSSADASMGRAGFIGDFRVPELESARSETIRNTRNLLQSRKNIRFLKKVRIHF